MSELWVPPYFGSWDELVQSVMQAATSSTGRGRHPGSYLMHSSLGPSPEPWVLGPQPEPWVLGPHPDPWRSSIAYLVSVLSLKDVIERIPDGHMQQNFSQRIDATIADILDDWCGTKPRPWPPRPWPGPPPWVFSIVTSLTLVANTLQEGRLRNDILDVAGQVVQKSFEAGMG